MDSSFIPRRTINSPFLTVPEQNAILDNLHQPVYNRKSIQTSLGTFLTDAFNPDRGINIKFATTVEPRSVFAIKFLDASYSPMVPNANVDLAVNAATLANDSAFVFCTNGETRVHAGTAIDCPVIGFNKPLLCRYSIKSGHPTIGKRLRVKGLPYNAFYLSSDGEFVAVSPPDPVNRYVWVTRYTPTIRNLLYFADLDQDMCSTNKGIIKIKNVVPLHFPENTDDIKFAKNSLGRAGISDTLVVITRKFIDDQGSGSGEGSIEEGSEGSGSGEGHEEAESADEFVILVVTPKCFDIPVAKESSCGDLDGSEGSNSGSGQSSGGVFLTREECGGSGSNEQGSEGSDSGGLSCAPISSYIQQVAIETCIRSPRIVDQLQLEMFDGIANINADNCLQWTNYVHCGFKSCIEEKTETAQCEDPCPPSGSAP